MRRGITVRSQAEGDALQHAVEDPIMRAAMAITAALLEVEAIADRRALLQFLLDTMPRGLEPVERQESLFRIHAASSGE